VPDKTSNKASAHKHKVTKSIDRTAKIWDEKKGSKKKTKKPSSVRATKKKPKNK